MKIAISRIAKGIAYPLATLPSVSAYWKMHANIMRLEETEAAMWSGLLL